MGKGPENQPTTSYLPDLTQKWGKVRNTVEPLRKKLTKRRAMVIGGAAGLGVAVATWRTGVWQNVQKGTFFPENSSGSVFPPSETANLPEEAGREPKDFIPDIAIQDEFEKIPPNTATATAKPIEIKPPTASATSPAKVKETPKAISSATSNPNIISTPSGTATKPATAISTKTAKPLPSSTPTSAPTFTSSPSPSPRPLPTFTETPTAPPTVTPSRTPIITSTPLPPATPTRTESPTPPSTATSTRTATATNTPLPPTPELSATPTSNTS